MIFRSEDEVDQWRRLRGRKQGATLSLEQVWELSRLWYSDRMKRDFRGHTAESALEVFAALDLTSEFWSARETMQAVATPQLSDEECR